MDYIVIILIVAIFSFIQSIIGIGLLMFGTPTLLILGFSFVEALNLLLVPSILISTLQIIKFKSKNDIHIINFKRNFFILCLPFLIVGLIFLKIFYEDINFQLFIGTLIFLSALIRILRIGTNYFSKVTKLFSKYFYPLIGIVHGVTNMGGSFLSMLASSIHPQDKFKARYMVGYAYLVMGMVQLIYINIFFGYKLNVLVLILGFVSFAIYFFIGNRAFKFIENSMFNNLVNYTIAIYGALLIIRNL